MIWSSVISWLFKNWLPVTIGVAVVGGYLWIANLQLMVKNRDERIEAMTVELQKVATEAKRQADAFTVLKQTMDDYQALVTEYVKRLENLMKQDSVNKEVVNSSGTEDARERPVDPFIREVLEKLCKLNPAHCSPL